MSTKTIKILTTVATILIIISMGASIVYAAKETAKETSIKPNGLTASYSGTGDIKSVGEKIMGIIQTVGVVVAVVILMVLGIKYMMGSAEEKAEYKKTMMPYVIGAVLIFAATTIATAIYNFASGI